MRKLVLGCVLAAALVLPTANVASAPAKTSGPDGLVTVCFVPKGQPDVERTIRVPDQAVDLILAISLAYRGPCADYGETAALGDGRLTAYTQVEDGVPVSVGVAFPSATLTGLPHDPPNDDLWCYDKNGDGVEDRTTECSGGYERAIHFAEEFREEVDSPFTYALVNWNPHGHVPPGIYNLPHFDLHYYVNPNEERLAIRPGPCPVLVNCDDFELGNRLPAPKYVAPDYEHAGAIEPGMGNHLVDRTGPEWNGEPFTHTFIYGTWDREVTFYEPMVTHEWFSGLVDGTREDGCFDMKLPQAWQESGWYPTRYCLRYRENRDELTASLEGFVYRQAG